MPTLDDYARHSVYTDPGRHAARLDALPTSIDEICAIVRNIVVHYRASGLPFEGDRLAEIDNRWISRLLDVDQSRHSQPLAAPRVEAQRVAGCCRDFTLLTVAALRHHGIPARSRIGFADYLGEQFHYDHVIVEHWTGDRWRWIDAQLAPEWSLTIDPTDVPRATTAGDDCAFASAAQVWLADRRGEIDVNTYGVDPDLPLRGSWFVRNYVISELAHRQRDELLLWDVWGAMRVEERPGSSSDDTLIDEIATLLVAADGGDESAERELTARYAADDRLRPGVTIQSYSPTGRVATVDLKATVDLA
jgi:hypothetical protein